MRRTRTQTTAHSPAGTLARPPAGTWAYSRSGNVGRYRIKGTDLTVHLRHASRDIEIFNEIFALGRMSYEPPAAVAAVLDSLGPLRIADLGGNIGLFGLYALHRWQVAALRSFEPDPANAALLKDTIAANEMAGIWELARVAVSNAPATATFEAGLLSESRLALRGDRALGTTTEVPVVDLFAQPPVDLLKIDIEGAEWAILGDPRLARHSARAVVLEWHRRMCPGPKARHAARALLEVGGYEAIEAGCEEAASDNGNRTDNVVLGDDDNNTARSAECQGGGTIPANGLMWGLRR